MTRTFLIVRAMDQSVDAAHEQHGFIRHWSLSPENTGFRALRMCAGVIPPGTVTKPHWHASCETALYVIQGRVEIHIGRGLKEIHYAGPGDFIYVPKGVIHQTITLDEPCHYIQVVDSAEEGTVEYDPLRDDLAGDAAAGADPAAEVPARGAARVADGNPSE